MERQGRIHKKTLPDGAAAGDIVVWDGAVWVIGDHGDITGVEDGTATGEILIWNDVTETWEAGDITDLTAILPDGTAAGQMLFWTGTEWTYAETSELMWDDTNKRMGINDSSPAVRLDVKGTVMMTRLLAGGITE